MEGDHPEIYKTQIVQIIQGLMQLKAGSKAFFPQELTELKNGLDDMSSRPGSYRGGNYDLFYRVSCILYHKDSLKMGELSGALSVPLSTATWMVGWLVDNGYAIRSSDPADRRVVQISLTERGKRLHEIAQEYLTERVDQLLSVLTDEERMILLTLLRKVVSAMTDARA